MSSSLARTALFLGLPAVAGLSLSFVACTVSTRSAYVDPPAEAETDAGTGGTKDQAPAGGFSDTDAGPAESDGCSADAKLVYVLSLEGDVYSFSPVDKKFTKVGPLNCTSGGGQFQPISMAVDRNAIAWVNMRGGSFFNPKDILFRFDTKTGSCTPSGIEAPGGALGGMSFSSNGGASGTSAEETLFIVGPGSSTTAGLNTVDITGKKLSLVANLASQGNLELTGTGDGRLYGFIVGNALSLTQIDKSAASFSKNVALPTVKKPAAQMYAFSFWGGDFYFYTADDTSMAKTTTVARYRPADGSIDDKYMEQIGFHIVGAGVSTCAPTTAPK